MKSDTKAERVEQTVEQSSDKEAKIAGMSGGEAGGKTYDRHFEDIGATGSESTKIGETKGSS